MKTKIKKWIAFRKIVAIITLLALIVASVQGLLLAQSVTQGFDSDESLQRGMIVRIKESDTSKVELLSQSSAKYMYGVVVDPNDSPVTLSTDDRKLFVATTGQYDVLVSEQNGQIVKGEYITISSIAGVGMKYDESQPVVIGRAVEDFNDSKEVIGTVDVDGRKANIGRIKADIAVAKNPLQKNTDARVPQFFSNTAEAIANRPVNSVRIYASLIIFIITSIIAIVVLYGGIRSGIISIGRNPLSKKSVIKAMLQVVVIGLSIFLSGVFGVYLLLKL